MKLNQPAPFSEIWDNLTKFEREELVRTIITDGHTVYYQVVTNWVKGKTLPAAQSLRDGIAKSVSRFLGIEVDSNTLFRV